MECLNSIEGGYGTGWRGMSEKWRGSVGDRAVVVKGRMG